MPPRRTVSVPFVSESAMLSVDVATHEGRPVVVSIWRMEPMVLVASAVSAVPLGSAMSNFPSETLVSPVPPVASRTVPVTFPAVPVMLAFIDVVLIWYREPELPPMRPERAARTGVLLNVLLPLQVFESPRSVVEAMVMLAVPLKEMPLIVRAVWSAVAVRAFVEVAMNARPPWCCSIRALAPGASAIEGGGGGESGDTGDGGGKDTGSFVNRRR